MTVRRESLRLRAPRLWLLAAIIGALVLVPSATHLITASAGAPTIAVVGDSITARYGDDSGSAEQGWWSFVGRHYDMGVATFAESGSGFGRPGLRCTGTRFDQRLDELRRRRPTVVFVEGGRNDWARCDGQRLVAATDQQIKRAVDSFLTRLQAAVAAGTPIYVLGPPWGSVDLPQRDRVTAIVKASSARHHLRFIDTTGVFDAGRRTVDGTHPNRSGSKALADRVIDTIGPTLPLRK